MSTSRTMTIRQIHIDAAAKRREITEERNNKTGEITIAWKRGFQRLKEENDRLQKERDDTFKSDMAEVGAWVNDQMEGLQQ